MRMQHCSSICAIAVSMCFGHPSHTFWPIFLGKACLNTWIGWLNQEFYNLDHKHGFNHPISIFTNPCMEQSILSHLEIAYTVIHIESRSFVYVFCIFCHMMHTTYIESLLKTTHCLFKWCHWLKVVDLFIAVYWLRVLGNLKFYLYSESENGYG